MAWANAGLPAGLRRTCRIERRVAGLSGDAAVRRNQAPRSMVGAGDRWVDAGNHRRAWPPGGPLETGVQTSLGRRSQRDSLFTFYRNAFARRAARKRWSPSRSPGKGIPEAVRLLYWRLRPSLAD